MSTPSKPSPSFPLPLGEGQGEGNQAAIISGKPVREITFAQAINEALAEEMRRDPRVFVIGEDVAEAGTPFKVLSGLVKEFGTDRVIDSPISEAGITGIGVGAAMTGMRPIVDIMFGDFLTLTMDQLVNQAAKIHYMSGGKLKVPMVLRTTLGATRRSAAQHSQSLHAWLSHIPGLKVVVPSTPYDAKGLLKSAHPRRQPGGLFRRQVDVPTQRAGADGRIHDSARCRRREARRERHHSRRHEQHGACGARGGGVRCKRAASAPRSSMCEPRRRSTKQTIIASVKKTSRAIVIDEGYERYGVDRRDRISHRGRRILLSRRAGKTDGCDGRARAVFSGARGPDRSDAGIRD